MRSNPLPVDYIPFSLSTLAEGQEFSLEFDVTPSSHDKTVARLFESIHQPSSSDRRYAQLLPSELWAMARVLSSAFGRLNELVLARTHWEMHATRPPGSRLYATTRIGRILRRRLPICTTHTETRSADGTLLVRADDDVLLVHDCPMPFFEERPIPPEVVPETVLYRAPHEIYCRYEWDPSVWVNNIHTDEYANRCGFKRGLPEFPTYMDWIYHVAVETGWAQGGLFSIDLRRILPMYPGDVLDVVAYESGGGGLQIHFLADGVSRMSALLTRSAGRRRRRGVQAEAAAEEPAVVDVHRRP